MFSVFESFFRASLEREERPPGIAKSVFSHFADSCTIVARARAVRMSPGATPEAQGARRSGRAEGTRRGLSARRNLRRGKRVNCKKPWARRGVAFRFRFCVASAFCFR